MTEPTNPDALPAGDDPSDPQWRRLQAEAAALDADAAAAQADPDQANPAQAVDPAVANKGVIVFLLTGFRELSCAILRVESPRRTLADPQIDQVATVLVPVCAKYGLDLSRWAGDWQLELAAIMTAGPILWTAYRELDEELRVRRARPIDANTTAQGEGERPGSSPEATSPPAPAAQAGGESSRAVGD